MCIYCGTNKYRQIYKKHHGPIPKDEDGRSYEIHHIDGNHSNNDPNNLKCVTIKEHYDIHYAQKDHGACFLMASRMNLSSQEISELSKLCQKKRVESGTHHFLGGEVQRKNTKKRIENGMHPLQKKSDGSSVSADRVKNGTHNFLGPTMNQKRVDDGSHNFLGDKNPSHERVKNGTHNLLGDKNPSHERVKNKTHHFLGSDHNNKRIKLGAHHFLGDKNPSHERVKNGTHNFLNPVDENHPTQFKWICPHCKKEGKGKSLFNRWHGNNCKLAI